MNTKINQLPKQVNNQIVSIDLETSGLSPLNDIIEIITIGFEEDEFYILQPDKFPKKQLQEYLNDLFLNNTILIHNSTFDLSFLFNHGFLNHRNVKNCYCTKVIYSTFCGYSLSASLANIVETEFGVKLDKSVRQERIWQLTDRVIEYCVNDVKYLPRIYKQFLNDNNKTIVKLDSKVSVILASSVGFRINRELMSELINSYEKKRIDLLDKLESEYLKSFGSSGLFEISGINWNSQKQIKQVFSKLGIKLDSTDDFSLAKIDNNFARLIRDYREATKKITAFGERFLEHCSKDNRIIPLWNVSGAATGRMSCSNPNLQQIPRDKEYRNSFLPEENCFLIKADYSQIELRVAALLSKDYKLITAFMRGDDIHEKTALQIFGSVDSEKRQISKSLNFGLLYGMNYFSFRDYLKTTTGIEISLALAKSYLIRWRQTYDKIALFQSTTYNLTKEQLNNNNFATAYTLLGRCRKISNDSNFLGSVLSTKISGTAADGMKVALCYIYSNLLSDKIKLISCVHDEIIFSVSNELFDKKDEIIAEIKKYMIKGMLFVFRYLLADSESSEKMFDVSIKYGNSWSI